jgi:hypothetical protein
VEEVRCALLLGEKENLFSEDSHAMPAGPSDKDNVGINVTLFTSKASLNNI